MRFAYIRHIWECGETLEVEEKHTGRYGASGQKRQKRKKATPEDIERQNQWKKERDLRRLIKWNFGKHDYWMTVTYRKGDRPTWSEMIKDIQKLIKDVLVNRVQSQDGGTDIFFSECWKKGHINFRSLYETGNFEDLAEYIAKPIEEWEPKEAKRYHPSRNLIRKEPKEKVINRRNLVDKQGRMIYPKAPKGYYIDPDSVRMGINPVTGYAYRHYTLIKLDRRI